MPGLAKNHVDAFGTFPQAHSCRLQPRLSSPKNHDPLSCGRTLARSLAEHKIKEELDTGDVDYAAVARYAREHRLPRRFTVELALEEGTRITRSAVENHRRSREFVRRVFET